MPLDKLTLDSIKETITDDQLLTINNLLPDMFDNLDQNQHAAKIQFFQNTQLSHCTWDSGNGPTLRLQNTVDNTSIEISNRDQAHQELRGNTLKLALSEYQKKHPNATIYDALQEQVHAPLTTFKNILTGKMSGTEKIFSPEQFDLLAKTLSTMIANRMPSINDKHFAGQKPNFRDFKEKYVNPEDELLKNDLWEGIDIQDISDRILSIPQAFTTSVEQLQQKANNLSRRGFTQSSDIIKTLHKNLLTEKEKFCSRAIDRETFANNCMHLLESAENSALRSHRGILGSLAIHLLSFGHSSKKPTDSMKKIAAIKASLQSFVNNADSSTEADSSVRPTK